MSSFTIDTFFKGNIRLLQKKNGYRVSLDAFLLAYYADPKPGDRILDLGTGCGIIPVILAHRHSRIKVYGVEIQEEMARLAVENVNKNRMQEHITILCRDMKALDQHMIKEKIDLVISNPPYRRIDSGRVNPNRQKAIARHELKATLAQVVETASRMLGNGGRFMVIYPAGRLTDILFRMRSVSLEPKCIRLIHSTKKEEAKLIIVEGMKGGKPGARIAPPLFIYQKGGVYTKEVEKMYVR